VRSYRRQHIYTQSAAHCPPVWPLLTLLPPLCPPLHSPPHLQGYFDMTLQAAALQLGVGVTTLKKVGPETFRSVALVGGSPACSAGHGACVACANDVCAVLCCAVLCCAIHCRN